MGCASSKYTADDDKLTKGAKKPKTKEKNNKNTNNNAKGTTGQDSTGGIPATTGSGDATMSPQTNGNKSANIEEDLDFIDKDELNTSKEEERVKDDSANGDDGKKEVTTYQTTVVKHIEKQGDELLEHLKTEAFSTFQNLLKQKSDNEEVTENIKSSVDGQNQSTYTHTSADSSDDLLNQIKIQAVNALGKQKQDFIHAVIDTSASFIKENKVKNMNELQESLEKQYGNGEFIKQIVNSATGFLTAKGTEAGSLLSNILANANGGLQGTLKETEKTTVKVTRTITERIVNSKGEVKISKTTTVVEDQSEPNTEKVDQIIADLKKNATGTKQKESVIDPNAATVTTTITETVNEVSGEPVVENKITPETTAKDSEDNNADQVTRQKAELVVNNVVSAAIQQLTHQSNIGSIEVKIENYDKLEQVPPEEKVQVTQLEQQQTQNESGNGFESLKDDSSVIASEFYKQGKEAAQILIKQIDNNNSTPSSSEQQQQTGENTASTKN